MKNGFGTFGYLGNEHDVEWINGFFKNIFLGVQKVIKAEFG